MSFFCVALLMYIFVLVVACLTVFVKCLVRTEYGMFEMYCMPCCMSVSSVL